MPVERSAILNDYMTWLARIHRIGTGPFEAAGLSLAEGNLIMADFDRWEATYRAKKAATGAIPRVRHPLVAA